MSENNPSAKKKTSLSDRLNPVEFARQRRQQKTRAETSLWAILRAKQVCGLKFRREHPIEGYIADFACVSEKLVVEIDGESHENKEESDLRRAEALQRLGWTVVRFADEDCIEDPEAVAKAVARRLGRNYEFVPRKGRGVANLVGSPPRPKAK